MDDIGKPLLGNQNGGQKNQAFWATDSVDEENILDMDVSDLLQHPESVITIIEKYGVLKLGQFEIEDSIAIRAFRGRSLLTLGAADAREIDWNAMWFSELDQYRPKGRLIEAGWAESVVVEAHVLSIRHAAGPPGEGLLQPILLRYQKQACPLSVFGLPAVQAVLNYKWEAWAARMLKIEFIMYLSWLLSFTIFVIIFQDEKLEGRTTFLPIWRNGMDKAGIIDKAKVILNFTSVLFMLPFVMIEINTIIDYGWQWLQYWNLLDVATYTIQILTCYIYVTGWNIRADWFSILLAMQCVFLFAKVQYFSRVFASAKSSLVDTLKVVISDVKWFLMFILLTLVSFALAFYILFRQEEKVEFNRVWHSIVSMFSFMLGGFDFHVFFESRHAVAAVCFFVLYEFIMAIMLLNLLIAIMTDSYSKVMENEHLWNLCSKAQIIDELETTLPKWLVRRWNPSYVHILKISPRRQVDMGSLHDRLDITEGRLASTSKEMAVKMSDLERKVMKRLDFLSKELELLAEHQAKSASEGPSRRKSK
ncbi:hypothetical protein BSKO_08106 [Bryopsis sp. KO-2023]|nr:hypothetical protein BSKO_08106 [Bryopsis sp. KO-2023]